ncbi:MAG TPA: hypothetical protein VMI12_19210 [Puia sp.]|nr:hypothetical protein [Puia sp.]
MNISRLASFVLICLLLPALQYAQNIDSMMNVYAENYPQEKVYFQFDKNIYIPGDTIWFKAYLFTGSDPSLVSKNFYTDLSDAKGNVIQRRIAPVFESTSSGSFIIPNDFKGNYVHLRGYTSWMMNFDTAFIFEKDIHILNRVRDSSGTISSPAESSLHFFPEGGDIIASLENNVAFMATDSHGLPIKVTGTLKDASGKDILEFNSVHDGMGKFLITPDKGDVFYAMWKDEKGIEHKTDFPPVKTEGVVLRMMPANKKVFFSVARSPDVVQGYDHLIIIGHMNQHLVYKAVVNLHDNFMSGGSIATDQLPSGVLQLTVFNSNNLPVAERVVFINNHSYEFSADLFVVQKNTAKRGKNTIDIIVKDTLGSNLSIAITDADADGKKINDDNIISGLLLTGEIRGYVHEPAYYFSNSSDSVSQYLDLVMLTHGWRRFKWEQLVRGKTPVIKYPPEDFLSVKAEVMGINPSRIASDETINVILQKKDSSRQMMSVPRLTGAKFGISGLMFYDTVRAFYQFNSNRNLSNEAAIVFSNGLLTGHKKIKPLQNGYTGWFASDSVFLKRNRFIEEENARIRPLQDKKVQTLETVTVRGRQKSEAQKLDEQYTSGLFSGGDAFSFDLVNDPIANSFMDIFAYLQGRVPGLIITTSSNGTSLQWRGSSPSIFMNEVGVDIDQMKNMPVSDVAMIKVFRPGSAVGFGGSPGGAIAVYTKKGAEKRIDPSIKGLEMARIPGYSVVREFYSPDYSQINDLNIVEDTRSTLYWGPYILTDKKNPKTTINFYNNDITKKLRVVLEGINMDGKLVRIEKIIQ